MNGSNGTPILLVDDDHVFRQAMADLLESEGYAVETALDGSDALARLRDGLRPALIMLDLVMPKKNGLQFRAEQILDPRLAAIPTVAYSTDTRMQPKAEAMGLQFFEKPDVRSVLDYVASLRLHGVRIAASGGFHG